MSHIFSIALLAFLSIACIEDTHGAAISEKYKTATFKDFAEFVCSFKHDFKSDCSDDKKRCIDIERNPTYCEILIKHVLEATYEMCSFQCIGERKDKLACQNDCLRSAHELAGLTIPDALMKAHYNKQRIA